MKIHLWAPGIDPNSGGIEKYSSFLLRALREIVGEENVSAFSKNDRATRSDCNGVTATGGLPAAMRTATFAGLVALRAWRERPDLIISTHVNFTPLALWLKKRLSIPYWASLHGIDAWNLTNEGRRRGLRNADLLLPVSSYTRDRVAKEQGLPLEHFRLLPNAFDASEFKIGPKPEYLLKRYGLSPEQPVILTVGRLASSERYKGHDRVLRALEEIAEQSGKQKAESGNASDLRSSNSHLRYLIVGDGDDRLRLEKLAEELGVSELVIFAGKVPAHELCDHYNLCDLFAMPSTGEGFGIVFLEALACGKPVIAGNKDASRDALLEGQLGVLVDAEDGAQLVAAICDLLAAHKPETGKQKAEMKNEEELRRAVIHAYGYDRFKERVATILETRLKSYQLKTESKTG